MGLCGESGEAIDIVKKHLAQGHDLNKEHLIEELGDIAWYLAETSYALDISLVEVLKLDPFSKAPPYEELVGDYCGFYSRRINIQHRLVYKVDKDKKVVYIIRMWTHYENL